VNNTAPTTYAPRKSDNHSDTGGLVAVAALAVLITVFVVLLLSRALSTSGANLTNAWVATFVLAPLVVAAMTTTLAWAAIQYIRVVAYTRALRGYIGRELTRDGLDSGRRMVSLRSTGAHDGRSGNAAQRLASLPRALLLGDEGAGKSLTLLAVALRETSLRYSARVALGLAPLPTPIWLPGLANVLAAGMDPDAYLAAWFRRSGANGLAARVPQLLRRGALALLCDDYDMLDADGRSRIADTLEGWRRASKNRLRLIVACDRGVFERDLDSLDALAEFPIERLDPLKPDNIARAFFKSTPEQRSTLNPTVYVSAALDRPIGPALTTPALARALAECYEADQPPSLGLGQLLRQQLIVRRERALARLEPTERDGVDVALIWGALAASLIAAQRGYLSLDSALLMGEAAATWFTEHPPLMPVSFALQEEVTFETATLERALKAGVEAGVLRREVDGLGLTFSHPLLRKSAAAYWLEAQDNGLGRLNSELLAEEWITPVLFWAGARNDSLDLAQRIYRLTQSPESVARRTRFLRSADVAPVALALGLSVALVGGASWLLAQSASGSRDTRRWFAMQQELRDLLDATAITAANDVLRPSLMRALRQANGQVGPTFEASLDALIRLETLDRLARAQLVLLLGLLATPYALQRLLAIMGLPDITLRQAARQALLYAGAEAIPTLQALAGKQTATELRERANEALRLTMAATPEAPEIAGIAAISGLNSADPQQRRAAVTTLSAIRASDALDALIARLGDTNIDVRLAATQALAQLGAADGLAALRKYAHAQTTPAALRRAIAEALGANPEPQSVATLLELLRDRESIVRAAAATALGAQGDSRAIGPLREAASDVDPWVNQAAQAAVRRLTGG
jgi:HEAT repeat protein